MAIVALTDPFPPAQYAGTFSVNTICTLTTGVPVGAVAVLAYVHNTSVATDTGTCVDSKSNVWTVFPSAVLANNSQTFMAAALVETALAIGDTVTFTSSVSRARRAVHIRAFTAADVAGHVTAATQNNNSTAPSVGLTTTVFGSLLIGAIGTNLAAGAVTWTNMTDPKSISTAAGTSDKTLSTGYRIGGSPGPGVLIEGTLAVSAPWGIVGVALLPATFVTGTLYQLVSSVWT